MKAHKLIALSGFLALSLLTAACSADTQASSTNHNWTDRAATDASGHNNDGPVSNSARGGD